MAPLILRKFQLRNAQFEVVGVFEYGIVLKLRDGKKLPEMADLREGFSIDNALQKDTPHPLPSSRAM